MPKVAKDVCLCGFVVYCELSLQVAYGTWVEKTTHATAGNYRGKLLGGIDAQLIVKAALTGRRISPSMRPTFCCDNLGIVHHGNHPKHPLPEKQRQGNTIHVFKHLIATMGSNNRMQHVFAHLNEVLCSNQLTIEEKLNCIADRLASEALVKAVASNTFISSCSPFEDLRLLVNGIKVTGSAQQAISSFWGSKVAHELFHDRRIVN